jgi:hypothetical protein
MTLRFLGGTVLALLGLAGCGGGGGASGPTAFSGFSEIGSNATVRIEGRGRSAVYTTAGNGNDAEVTAVSDDQGTQANDVVVALDGGDVATAEAEGGDTEITFDFDDGDRLGPSNGSVRQATSPDASRNDFDDVDDIAVVADPTDNDFEYQTYGVWQTGRADGDGEFEVAAASYGLASAAADVDALTGTADYDGVFSGLYNDGAGSLYATGGSVGMTVDFDADTFTMQAFVNDSLIRSGPGANRLSEVEREALEFATSGATDVSGNRFSGEIAAREQALTGDVEGTVYGDGGAVADEVGGTFRMDDADSERAHMGAFGATRTPD